MAQIKPRRVMANIYRSGEVIVPMFVFEHEVQVLQAVHGEDRVEVIDEYGLKRADIDIAAYQLGETINAEDEYARLRSVYGDNVATGRPRVEEVYGRFETGQFLAAAGGEVGGKAKAAKAD